MVGCWVHIRIVFCLVGSVNVNYVCMSESHGSELLLVFQIECNVHKLFRACFC